MLMRWKLRSFLVFVMILAVVLAYFARRPYPKRMLYHGREVLLLWSDGSVTWQLPTAPTLRSNESQGRLRKITWSDGSVSWYLNGEPAGP